MGCAVSDIAKVVLDYVTREYLEEGDPRKIDLTTRLISGGIVDSFSMVSLLRFLEKKYSIHIPNDAATPDAFDTVENIAALVQQFQKVAA